MLDSFRLVRVLPVENASFIAAGTWRFPGSDDRDYLPWIVVLRERRPSPDPSKG
jgi:hypothetical protein